VADGTRTHDNWNHNPGLYQLSYSHHWKLENAHEDDLARPAGLEPTTAGLEGRCSIRLSYGRDFIYKTIDTANSGAKKRNYRGI
jgi:hypothetical protein